MFSTTIFDAYILGFLVVVAVIVSLVTLSVSKNKKLSFIVLSCGLNGAFFLIAFFGSGVFFIYDTLWLAQFSLFIWPIVNIVLITQYSKQSKK